MLIGLTGGIASGKSLALDRFAELGAATVDADRIAREVVAPGTPGLAALVDRFGDAVLDVDGALDRSALRGIVFADPGARADLDALLHPLIRERSDERIAEALATGAPYVVYAVPLLVETGQVKRFDRVLVVDVPVTVQLERLLARDGRNEVESRRIIDAQASRQARLAVADDVVTNDGAVAATLAAVDRLHERYSGTASKAPGR